MKTLFVSLVLGLGAPHVAHAASLSVLGEDMPIDLVAPEAQPDHETGASVVKDAFHGNDFLDLGPATTSPSLFGTVMPGSPSSGSGFAIPTARN